MITPIEAIFPIVRPIVWRTLTLAVIIAGAPSARAGEAYQVATISSLLAGGYDGDT
jgi:acetolactate decarboxylase